MDRASWSPAIIRKAEAALASHDVTRDAEHPLVFWVRGSTGNRYRVQTDGETWLTCTCPNGMHQPQPHCFHSCAVLMVLRDGIEVPTDER